MLLIVAAYVIYVMMLGQHRLRSNVQLVDA
jgi:hypothetical protein